MPPGDIHRARRRLLTWHQATAPRATSLITNPASGKRARPGPRGTGLEKRDGPCHPSGRQAIAVNGGLGYWNCLNACQMTTSEGWRGVGADVR